MNTENQITFKERVCGYFEPVADFLEALLIKLGSFLLYLASGIFNFFQKAYAFVGFESLFFIILPSITIIFLRKDLREFLKDAPPIHNKKRFILYVSIVFLIIGILNLIFKNKDFSSLANIVIVVFQIWIAFWMFHKQMDFQKKADRFIKKSTNKLASDTQNIFDLIVGLKQDFLRLFREIMILEFESKYSEPPKDKDKDKGNESHKQYISGRLNYWDFKYRFETEDIVILTVKRRDKDKNKTFNLSLKVYGTTETLKKDQQFPSYYLCDVIKSKSPEDFEVNDKVACYFSDNSICVSKKVDLLHPMRLSHPPKLVSVYEANIFRLHTLNKKTKAINVSSIPEDCYHKIPKDFKLDDINEDDHLNKETPDEEN